MSKVPALTKCALIGTEADFHIAIYEATHNIVLLHVMRSLSSMLRSGVLYSREKLYNRNAVRGLFRNQHNE